jgi:hypothetical protein
LNRPSIYAGEEKIDGEKLTNGVRSRVLEVDEGGKCEGGVERE